MSGGNMNYLNFNEKELSNELKESAIKEVRQVCLGCKSCGLSKGRTNVVFSDGKASAPIMLIGEAPGADEDATGVPFVGKAGKLLTQLIKEVGLSRENDFYICNTVKCRPPENRVPTDEEKQICEQFLSAQISIIRPKGIILCGSTSAKSFLGNDIKITQIRGKWFKLMGSLDAIVIFHPSYLLRNRSEEENSPIWHTKQDLIAVKNFIYN